MKKSCMILMALVLCLVMVASALAAGVPSKTLKDMTTATTEGGFAVIIIEEENDIQDWVTEELGKIGLFTEEGNEIASYFDETVFEDCEKDVNGMILSEAEAIYASGYELDMGEQKVTFTFPVVYDKDTVVLLGTYNEDEKTVSYSAFDGAANEAGEVEVLFDAETLEAMEGIDNQVLMLLLSESVAE